MQSLFILPFCFAVLIFFHSCRIKNVHNSNENKSTGALPIQKPGSSFRDSLFILFPAAVFFSPDPIQKSAISKVTEPAVFESSLHEYYYQMRNARQYLKDHWQKITVADAMNFRYLVFRKADGGVTIIDLNQQDPCGMFVFDRIKDPLLIDMTNVDTQVSDYFSIHPGDKHE
jgi:hypothetical protein